MSFLQDRIRAASQKYYSGEEPIMTDAEFDAKLDELKKENPNDPLVTELGHGYDVNLDSTSGQKFKHLYSEANGLDKAYSWKELKKELRSENELGISLKLDGLSVILYYFQGKLDKALTRGKDNIGIDITEKVLEIEPTYAAINNKVTAAFRGEILMTDKMFRMFKAIHPEAKNSRNSAAGLINADDNHNPDLEFLNIYMYTVFGIASDVRMKNVIWHDHLDHVTYREMMMYLSSNFNHVVPFTSDVITEENYLDLFEKLKNSWSSFGLPDDGIVLTDMIIPVRKSSEDSLPYGPSDEFTPYSFNYISDAFKFKSEVANTKVRFVEWNMTRFNRCRPVVHVDPVDLAGTTVTKCTGYHAQYILDNRIHPGTIVEIEKRGEIIPNINKVVENDNMEVCLPSSCPICDGTLKWRGIDLVCTNAECSNTSVQDTLIWCKTIAPVDGLSDKLITKFIKEYVTEFSIPGVMKFDISEYNSNNESQFGKFCKMIEGLHNNYVPCDVGLRALNIPRLGEETSKKLGKNLELVCQLIHTFDEGEAYMMLLEVLGQADSKAIANNLNKLHRLILIEDRLCVIQDLVHEKLAGQVVITGKLSVSRSKFESELKSAGFKVSSSVNKNTLCLITDNPNSSSSKNRAADVLGITKLSEKEFRGEYLK